MKPKDLIPGKLYTIVMPKWNPMGSPRDLLQGGWNAPCDVRTKSMWDLREDFFIIDEKLLDLLNNHNIPLLYLGTDKSTATTFYKFLIADKLYYCDHILNISMSLKLLEIE